jgi:hypothetical protein
MHLEALLNAGRPIHRALIIESPLDGFTGSHLAVASVIDPKVLTRTLLP